MRIEYSTKTIIIHLKNIQFTSQYDANIYKIFTNDLGFRDDSTQPLDRDKEYSILIGDSFIEGVGLDYEDYCRNIE